MTVECAVVVSVIVPGASGPGSSPDWGHCVVFSVG